jgi:hypothetical protein
VIAAEPSRLAWRRFTPRSVWSVFRPRAGFGWKQASGGRSRAIRDCRMFVRAVVWDAAVCEGGRLCQNPRAQRRLGTVGALLTSRGNTLRLSPSSQPPVTRATDRAILATGRRQSCAWPAGSRQDDPVTPDPASRLSARGFCRGPVGRAHGRGHCGLHFSGFGVLRSRRTLLCGSNGRNSRRGGCRPARVGLAFH